MSERRWMSSDDVHEVDRDYYDTVTDVHDDPRLAAASTRRQKVPACLCPAFIPDAEGRCTEERECHAEGVCP